MASGVMGKAPERSLCLHPAVSILLPTYLKIPLPLAQLVKNPPASQETRVRYLGQEDPLEKEMANHSSTLAWKIPWAEEAGGLRSMESQESDPT